MKSHSAKDCDWCLVTVSSTFHEGRTVIARSREQIHHIPVMIERDLFISPAPGRSHPVLLSKIRYLSMGEYETPTWYIKM